MYTVVEIKKTTIYDLPTHWSIYKDGCNDPILCVWTTRAVADRICGWLNSCDEI